MDLTFALQAVRETAPLVHVITNFVTVNDCANIILAMGGAPTMAHDIREVAEVTEACQSLVLNMGAIADVEAMLIAGRRANALGHPVILDPVAAGCSQLRRDVSRDLLHRIRFDVIRGNASEIRALAQGTATGSGVDVEHTDVVTEENLPVAMEMAEDLANQTGAVIVVSGAMDLITDGTRSLVLHNGCATMARITGSGCMLTALTGAFCGALPEQPLEAAVAAVSTMGICGELAERRRLQNGTGTATFRNELMDAVSCLTEQQWKEGVRYAFYER